MIGMHIGTICWYTLYTLTRTVTGNAVSFVLRKLQDFHSSDLILIPFQ